MNRRSRRVQIVLIAVFATAAVALSDHFAWSISAKGAGNSSSPPPANTPCGCSDFDALVNRAAEVRAAIAALKNEIEVVKGLHLGDEAWSQKYNANQDLHLLVGDIQKAMDAVHDPAITNRVKNMTFPSDCSSSARGPTPCLQAAADAGDSTYVLYCKTLQSLSTGGRNNAWQSQMELAEKVSREPLEVSGDPFHITRPPVGRAAPCDPRQPSASTDPGNP
jgi:hypothetical protein